jgi:hypothetical protein
VEVGGLMSGECSMVPHGGRLRCPRPAVVTTMCCGALCAEHFEKHEGCPFGFHIVRKPELHDVGGAFHVQG